MRGHCHIADMVDRELAEKEARGALRHIPENIQGADFCSNDYLGLARVQLLSAHSNGSTGSRLICGDSTIHRSVETRAADHHHAECALLFNSGYDANLGLISAMGRRGVTIIIDELSHASIHDGARLSLARVWKFAHNDATDLCAKIKRTSGPCIVVVEALYSMDGDEAPLSEIAEVCNEFGAALIVDEAHSAGVFGEKGAGIVCREGLEEQVFARVVTFGKAFGRHGAVVLGSSTLRKYLINSARSLIYSTALAPHAAAALVQAYDLVANAEQERRALDKMVETFQEEAALEGVKLHGNSRSQIQAVIVPGNEQAQRLANGLRQEGYSVHAVRAPTVPAGLERIRITLHSYNTEGEVRGLARTVAQLMKQGENR